MTSLINKKRGGGEKIEFLVYVFNKALENQEYILISIIQYSRE